MIHSDHTPCCLSVITTGLSNTLLLGNYNFNGILINDRPLYVGEGETYGLWFNGQNSWLIGLLTNLNDGKVTYGFAFSNKDTDCPTFTSISLVYHNGKWENNVNGRLECLDSNSDHTWTWTDDRTCNSDFKTWMDNRGFNCQHYSDKDWCTSEGKYGQNWGDQGFFQQYAKDGLSTLNCPQCGCNTLHKKYCDCDNCVCEGNNYKMTKMCFN